MPVKMNNIVKKILLSILTLIIGDYGRLQRSAEGV